jgi:hypothetical protein
MGGSVEKGATNGDIQRDSDRERQAIELDRQRIVLRAQQQASAERHEHGRRSECASTIAASALQLDKFLCAIGERVVRPWQREWSRCQIEKRCDTSASTASIAMVNASSATPIDGCNALCSPAAATMSGDGVSPAASVAAS